MASTFQSHTIARAQCDPEQMRSVIDDIFRDAHHQSDYLIAFYRLVHPDWDSITKINGYPKAGKDVSNYIWRKAIAFDQKHHPEVLAGGCWMNSGFATIEDTQELPSWQLEPCKDVTY